MRLKSSDDWELHIAELKEQLKQAKLQKKEAENREREQAREWRAELVRTLGESILTVVGCDWTRFDPDALRMWLLEHSEEMREQFIGPERTPAEAHDDLIAFRRGPVSDTAEPNTAPTEAAPEPSESIVEPENDNAGSEAVGDFPTMATPTPDDSGEMQDSEWRPQGEGWQPQQGWN